VIVSARSSDGAVANVLAVNTGETASGLAEANVVADAVAGRGAFEKVGRQTHIRVMADLFTQSLHLVVPIRSRIHSVADLKGKWVSLGNARSGGEVIAEEILAAYGIKQVKIVRETVEISGGLLREGKIDAFFFLGSTPDILIADMVGRGQARLIPIDGKGRSRLVATAPGLAAGAIAAGTYRSTQRLETVSSRTLWIVRDSAPADAVYELVRALNHPANRPLLASGEAPPIKPVPATAAAPLHAGAARYWREIGALPK
jgi:TRAP transporter TAXI family solute receptor